MDDASHSSSICRNSHKTWHRAPANTAGCEPATLPSASTVVFKLVGRIEYREIEKKVQSNQLLNKKCERFPSKVLKVVCRRSRSCGSMNQQVLAYARLHKRRNPETHFGRIRCEVEKGRTQNIISCLRKWPPRLWIYSTLSVLRHNSSMHSRAAELRRIVDSS